MIIFIFLQFDLNFVSLARDFKKMELVTVWKQLFLYSPAWVGFLVELPFNYNEKKEIININLLCLSSNQIAGLFILLIVGTY